MLASGAHQDTHHALALPCPAPQKRLAREAKDQEKLDKLAAKVGGAGDSMRGVGAACGTKGGAACGTRLGMWQQRAAGVVGGQHVASRGCSMWRKTRHT